MKLLKLYSWFTGTMADFAKPFSENKALYTQARAFWNKLDNASAFIVILFVVLGVTLAAYYYTLYNDKPGRRYTPKQWAIMLLITIIATFIFTLAVECWAIEPRLNGAFWLEFKIAAINALYAAGVYFVTSLIWCNWFPTNAYRFLKLSK